MSSYFGVQPYSFSHLGRADNRDSDLVSALNAGKIDFP